MRPAGGDSEPLTAKPVDAYLGPCCPVCNVPWRAHTDAGSANPGHCSRYRKLEDPRWSPYDAEHDWHERMKLRKGESCSFVA